jgi:hypothetical protein
LLTTLSEIGYDGYLTAEGTLRGDPLEALTQQATHIRRLWAATPHPIDKHSKI